MGRFDPHTFFFQKREYIFILSLKEMPYIVAMVRYLEENVM